MSPRVCCPACAAPEEQGQSHAPWEGANLPPGVYLWGVAAVTALGAALRLAHIARPFNGLMAWNEGHYAMTALNFDRYGLWVQRNDLGVDHTFSPGVPWLIWASFKLFGPTEWAARLPIVLSGIAAVALFAALVRRLLRSEQIALIASAFVAVAPGVVYFAQNVQLDTPSICCALAGAVCMLRYREVRRLRYFVAAGMWLAAAIWLKFPTALLYPAYLALWWPARPAHPAAAIRAAALFFALTALPSAAWVLSGLIAHETNPGFFYRRGASIYIANALLEIPLEVEAHLFLPVFVLVLAGIPVVWRWRSRLREIGIWCAPLIILYVIAPWDSLANRYYDLPATYLLTVPAALAVWARRPPEARHGNALPRTVVAAVAVVLALTVAYDLWDPTTDRIARATIAHAPIIDPVPFFSARIVADLPRGRTVVDAPQTMFYAGGDPSWVQTAWDVRPSIDSEQFDYIVLNDFSHGMVPTYAVDESLRALLARHHYIQIAPAAWAHEWTFHR